MRRYLDCESRETHVNTLQECSRRSPWPGRAAGEGYIKHSMMLQTFYTYSKTFAFQEEHLHVANIRGYKGICLFTAARHCSAQFAETTQLRGASPACLHPHMTRDT